MTRSSLHYTAFFVGLATVCWVGAGYATTNPTALGITLLIGVFYLMGALELRRFDQATRTLAQATAELTQAPSVLETWLERLHPSLRNAVRLRVAGERVGLPGPALTPYLAGLLVLLGMLGTFVGMVATLKGTGIALENAADAQAIRDSLSAPVKGLGLAFGTSVAGVAASAMLGLVSALCRRDRLQAAQGLDTRIATTLRHFSAAHQRDESFRLLQGQARSMPELVDRLQAMMGTMERQAQAMAQHAEALNDRLVANQERFHGQAEASYARLASAVDRSLRESLTESARLAGATIQPVVEATMAGIARETATLQETVSRTVQRQLEGVSTRVEAGTAEAAALWQSALAEHRQASGTLASDLRGTLDRFSATFDARSAALVEGVAGRLEGTTASLATTWRDALASQVQASADMSGKHQQALEATTAGFERHAASLLNDVQASHATLHASIASGDQQRLAGFAEAMRDMAATLGAQWQRAGELTVAQQEQICRTLAETARDMSAQAQAHAQGTLAEIDRLVQAASEAPRAAAEVVAALRQKLSESMARDNDLLEERGRLLGTLSTVLDAVNHASTGQRTAIDSLVAHSAELLDRVGARFNEKVEAETGKMAALADQVAGSAVEVASLGEAFGFAVQLFSQSNEKLGGQLQRIEAALGKSTARSDEQLAYYVAQAREVIDLSIMSQKQIVEDLQHLASQRTLAASEA